MRIAMAQIEPATGDLTGNAERIVEAVDEARRRGCDLVVLPELAVTGYMSGDLLEVRAYIEANERLLREVIAPRCTGITAVVGFAERAVADRAGARLHNAAAVLRDGRVQAVARKQNLCRYRFFDETRYFVPGEATTVVELDLDGRPVPTGILICEDLWDAEYPAAVWKEAADQGARLLLTLNASPFQTGKWEERRALIRRHQEMHPLPVIYANTVGIGDNLKDIVLFDGRSVAVDAAGRAVALGPIFRSELMVAELDEAGRGTPLDPPAWEAEEEVRRGLTYALREYARQTGFERVVVGVSGGVDSALCTALAAEALGPERVLALSLPSVHTGSRSRGDAEELCRNLGVELREIPIAAVHDAARGLLGPRGLLEQAVTDENLQARIRGMLLMAVSNETGRLVVATGNKTELGLGYCTLYGDMVGGLLLIGDLNKQEVYRLTEHMNRRAGRSLVPQSILERAPTAELSPDQEDPFDYPVVAPLIDDIIARRSPGEILRRFERGSLGEAYPADVHDRYDASRFAALVLEVYDRYQRAAFKRAQASPTVIVSRRALGFDLRETILDHWRPAVPPQR